MKKILFILIVTNTLLLSKHIHKEKFYQKIFCNKINGLSEYTLKDKTRVDCLTSNYAFEVDFANKWAESIGQSLYYGLKTKKKSAVLLILEQKKKELKYLNKLKIVAKQHNIDVFTIDKNLIIKKH